MSARFGPQFIGSCFAPLVDALRSAQVSSFSIRRVSAVAAADSDEKLLTQNMDFVYLSWVTLSFAVAHSVNVICRRPIGPYREGGHGPQKKTILEAHTKRK